MNIELFINILNIVSAFGSLMGKIVEIGGNIVKGLWQGIQQLASWLPCWPPGCRCWPPGLLAAVAAIISRYTARIRSGLYSGRL